MQVDSKAGLWLPPLVLMGVIFFFSAQPDLSSGLGWIDFVLRKIVHMAEYGLLALLWWRALAKGTNMHNDRAMLVALALTVLYAASDEWHQSFIEGRHGTPVDVLIDGTGAAIALLVVHSRLTRRSAA